MKWLRHTNRKFEGSRIKNIWRIYPFSAMIGVIMAWCGYSPLPREEIESLPAAIVTPVARNEVPEVALLIHSFRGKVVDICNVTTNTDNLHTTAKHCVQMLWFQPSYQYDMVRAKNFTEYVSQSLPKDGAIRYDIRWNPRKTPMISPHSLPQGLLELEIRWCLPSAEWKVVACYKIRWQALKESHENDWVYTMRLDTEDMTTLTRARDGIDSQGWYNSIVGMSGAPVFYQWKFFGVLSAQDQTLPYLYIQKILPDTQK